MSWLNGNVDDLAKLLKFAVFTIKAADRNKHFSKPLSKLFRNYNHLIANPIDLSLIDKNVKNKYYASTKSFLADVKWVYILVDYYYYYYYFIFYISTNGFIYVCITLKFFNQYINLSNYVTYI